MKPFLSCLILMLVCLCGCYHARTRHGGFSADKRYELWVAGHGAGKAYAKANGKHIYVRIKDRETSAELFRQEFKFVAANLSWRVDWRSTNDITVEFFDYGDKIPVYDHDSRRSLTSNHVATLRFERDPVTGKFSEMK